MKRILFLLTFLPVLSNAQVNLDSLWRVWNDEAQADTNRLKAIADINWNGYLFTQPDSAFYFAQLRLDFAKEKGQKKHIASALYVQGISCYLQGDYDNSLDYYTKSLKFQEEIENKIGIGAVFNSIGIIYKRQGDYGKAIDYYTKSLKIQEEMGDKSGIATALNNIGAIFQDQGDHDKALDYYTKSLKIEEEIGGKRGIAASLGSIGTIYRDQGDYGKALDYHTKSLKIQEEIVDKRGIAAALNNIGTILQDQGDHDKAMDHFTKSLKIQEEMGNKSGIAAAFINIGNIFQNQGDYGKALDYYTKSLKIHEEIGDKSVIAVSLNNIGTVYIDLGDYDKSIDYGKRSLAIAQETDYTSQIRYAAQLLWKGNKKLGKYKESLEMYELYIAARDSLVSEDNQKATIRQEYKYAYEKQAAADSVKVAEAGKVKDALLVAEKAENKQHQQQQYFLYAGLAIALLFGAIIFNRFKLANKQKGIIEQQKKKVDDAYDGLEEAHKEITDSINYAERIQRSFLATDDLLNENLNEYFVYFNPKEAVSGDFYWAGKLSNGNFALVNADSTGHGVPGAIMSILNISSIEKAVEKNATNPADIFNQTRKTIIERLKKDGSLTGGKDGMDASLISFNPDKSKMTYVAAQNPIWIVRNNENGVAELVEVKPEKMPVGKHDKDHILFNGGEYDLQKGDQIYTLTDGFQDQFGGPKGKKFMIKNMREYVLSICHLPMQDQHQKIKETFANWKGDVEQVDDVCVIGVRI